MVLALGILSGTSITPNDTLLILDKIQECPRALNALKFLHENAPEYHVVVAGSLLGVAEQHRGISFPVGQVDFLHILPMTFGEFLEAMEEKQLRDLTRQGKMDVIRAVREKFIRLLRQYMYVGGMPEAVAHFAKERDLQAVRRIQNQILDGYARDFSKYTQPRNIPRIPAVWNSIPAQLARVNKKYTYKNIVPSARAREYEGAIEWLRLCGLIHRAPRISKPAHPISSYADNAAFKLYLLDVGLLGAAARLDAAVLISGLGVFEEFKGALTEQYVLQQLRKRSTKTLVVGHGIMEVYELIIIQRRESAPL